MAGNGRKIRGRDKAAELLAEGSLSERQIAAVCRIGERTLRRWKQQPAFMELVTRFQAARRAGADQAVQKACFDTVTRLIDMANLSPEETNGCISAQVAACIAIAKIRREIITHRCVKIRTR